MQHVLGRTETHTVLVEKTGGTTGNKRTLKQTVNKEDKRVWNEVIGLRIATGDGVLQPQVL
jgi:hypothetical protein